MTSNVNVTLPFQAVVSTEGEEEIVDYIPHELLGVIIGKKHSTLNKIFKDTGALLTTKSGTIMMKGTSEQRQLAHAAIRAKLVII